MRVLLLVVLLVVAPTLSADVFTGVGQSVLIGDQRADAERLAMDVARSDALKQAIKAYAADGGIDEHALNAKLGQLLSTQRDFLRGERLRNAQYDAPLLKIELEVDVDMDGLARALGLQGLATRSQQQARRDARPVTVVIVAEELNGSMNSFPYSAGIVQKQLLAAEYDLIDSTVAARAAKHDQAVQALFNNDPSSAQALALQFDAGLMVTGRTVVQASGLSAGGMSSYGANVALSAIAADSGKVLATAAADANYPHVNAITGSRLAAEAAAVKAITQLLRELDALEQGTQNALRMTVEGINFQQLAILKKLLARDFPEVVNIQTRGFGGDIARLDVALSAPATNFAEALAAKDFGAFRLRVLSQSSGKLDATVVMR